MNTQQQVFLWACFGSPNVPPDRLEVTTCARCSALVPVDDADLHRDWHHALGGAGSSAQSSGVACVRCGRLDGPMTPTGERSKAGVQLFACTPRCDDAGVTR